MIYSLEPNRQAREKLVFGKRNHQASVLLFDRLEGQIQTVVKKTGLPAVVIYDHEQHGATFGERYAAAFKQLFQLGYDQVISVGNDIPALNERHILQAQKGLQSNESVLGPARDGGDYLIALSKSDFEEKSFAALPWRTDRLHEALLQYLIKQRSVLCMEYLVDIDSAESLAHSITQSLDLAVKKFLKSLLKSLAQIEFYVGYYFYRLSILHFGPRRAPPQSAVWIDGCLSTRPIQLDDGIRTK